MSKLFGFGGVMAACGILLATSSPSAFAATVYYVDVKSTAGTEDGTAAAPFKTLNNAFDGTPTFNDGDEVRVGTGTYDLTGHISFPDFSNAITGVLLKGGYSGVGTGAFDDSAADAMARPVTVNVGLNTFYLDNKSVIDGLRIQGQTGGQWVFQFNDSGAKVRNSDLNVNNNGFYVNAQHSVIEDNTIQHNNCNYSVYIENSGQATIQRNTFRKDNCSDLIYLNPWSRAVIRWNTLEVGSGNAIGGYGFLHAYQNHLVGAFDNHNGGTAFHPYGDHYWLVNNNNISHFYWAFDASSQDTQRATRPNVDDSNYRTFNFDDNHVFMNGYDEDGTFYMDDYPISGFMARGNCFDSGTGTSLAEIEGDDSLYFYPASVKELQEVVPENFSGNIQNTALVSNPKAPACGNKGVVTTLLSTKPVARPYAYDNTQYTETPDIAVHPGEPFWLNGDQSINFEGGPLSFTWSQVSGPRTLTLDSQDAYNEEVTAFATVAGKYVFRLVARAADGSNIASAGADVTVWVMDKVVVTKVNGTERGRYKFLQAALLAAQPGDTVTLPQGMFLLNPYDDGVDTYESVEVYGKSDLVIQGQGSGANRTLIGSRAWDNVFDVQYSRNITIRNMDFFDPASQGYHVISSYGVNNLVVDNVGMDGRLTDTDEGYFFEPEYTSLTLRNSVIKYIYEPVYFYESGQVIVENNVFEAIDDYMIEVDLYEDNDWIIIRNNIFNAKTMGDTLVYICDMNGHTGADSSGNGAIFTGNSFTNAYGEAIYLSTVDYSGTLIQDNRIYTDRRWTDNGDYGIYISDARAVIRNNIIYNTYYDGVYNSSGVAHLEGNVIAFSDDYGIYNDNYDCYYECTYYATARNNVLYNNADGPYHYVNVLDGNSFADPMFVNPDLGNFTPMAGSPLLSMPGVGVKVAPAPPAGLRGEALAGAARLIFDAVDGATGYKIYWGDSAGVYEQSLDLGSEQVALVDGLAAMPYYFAIAARNGNGESVKSAAVIVTPAPAAVSEQSQPAVEGVYPNAVRFKSATEIEISGADFREGAKVYVGSTEIDVIEVTENLIKATTTADVKAGMHPIVVVNADLGRGALSQALNVRRAAAAGNDEGGCASNGQGASGFALLLLPALYLMRRRMQY